MRSGRTQTEQRPAAADVLSPIARPRTADELGDADISRVFVDLGRRADLNDVSLDHDGDAARHRHRLGLVMGHVDKGGFQLAMQLGEFGAHMHAQLGIEIGQRFVEQKPERLAHDGASDRHALPLPARQLSRLASEQTRKFELGGDPLDFLADTALCTGASRQQPADQGDARQRGMAAHP
jgi:hypothetical protein